MPIHPYQQMQSYVRVWKLTDQLADFGGTSRVGTSMMGQICVRWKSLYQVVVDEICFSSSDRTLAQIRVFSEFVIRKVIFVRNSVVFNLRVVENEDDENRNNKTMLKQQQKWQLRDAKKIH